MVAGAYECRAKEHFFGHSGSSRATLYGAGWISLLDQNVLHYQKGQRIEEEYIRVLPEHGLQYLSRFASDSEPHDGSRGGAFRVEVEHLRIHIRVGINQRMEHARVASRCIRHSRQGRRVLQGLDQKIEEVERASEGGREGEGGKKRRAREGMGREGGGENEGIGKDIFKTWTVLEPSGRL